MREWMNGGVESRLIYGIEGNWKPALAVGASGETLIKSRTQQVNI